MNGVQGGVKNGGEISFLNFHDRCVVKGHREEGKKLLR